MEELSVVSCFFFFVSSFLMCIGVLQLLMPVALRVNLLDVPGDRKLHSYPTPLIGGISIFLTLALVSATFAFEQTNWSMLLWFSVVLVVGIKDDMSDLSYKARMLIHMLVVVGIWLTDSLVVQNIGAILNPESVVSFSAMSAVLFTAIAVIGAINAVNMIDGVDGILGSLMFISLTALLLMPWVFDAGAGFFGSVLGPLHITALLGALGAFLVLNARFLHQAPAKVYMGDAGSTVLGFLLVYMLIDFTQGENALFSPVVAGWILGVPLLDGAAVIVKRLLNKQSPVAPGRDHIHHILMNSGFGVNQTVGVLLICQIMMILIALMATITSPLYSDVFLFWGFIALVLIRLIGEVTLIRSETTLVGDLQRNEANIANLNQTFVKISMRSNSKRVLGKSEVA